MKPVKITITSVANGYTLTTLGPALQQCRTFVANDENEVLAQVACLLMPKAAEGQRTLFDDDEDEA